MLGHLHKLSVVIADATARQILEAKPELASFTFLNYNMNAVHYAAGARAGTPCLESAQQLCGLFESSPPVCLGVRLSAQLSNGNTRSRCVVL